MRVVGVSRMWFITVDKNNAGDVFDVRRHAAQFEAHHNWDTAFVCAKIDMKPDRGPESNPTPTTSWSNA